MNGGVSKARNIALDKCKGEYVCFVDSDDWIEPDMIEYLYSLLMKNFSYKIAACGIFEMDNSKNRDVSYKIREEAFQYVWDVPFLWNKIFFTKLIKNRNLKLNEKIIVSEDSLFCFQAIEACGGIIVGEKNKYHYFQENSGSATHQNFKIERVNSLIGYKYMAEQAGKMKLKNCLIYECGYVSQCIRMLLHKMVSDQAEYYKNIRAEIRRYLLKYVFTNGCRLSSKVKYKFKILAIVYSVLPYRVGKNIAKY